MIYLNTYKTLKIIKTILLQLQYIYISIKWTILNMYCIIFIVLFDSKNTSIAL